MNDPSGTNTKHFEEISALKQKIRELEKSVTESRRTEEVLRENEKKYRFLTENMADIAFMVDMDLRTTYVSPSVEKILGFTPEERETQRVEEQMPSQSLQLVFETLTEEMKRETAEDVDQDRSQTLSLDYYHKDGSIKSLETNIRGIRDSEGTLRGFYGLSRDITEHKRMEEALRESEQKYRELVENANSIILRWSQNGEISFLNEFGLQFFGYYKEAILGRHVVGTIVPESESTGRDLRPLMDKITANPKDFEQNINENMRSNGDRVWISWTNKAVLDREGKVLEILSIGSDITERKQVDEELQHTLESLRKAFNTTIQVMVSAVETRDPYTAGHQVRSANLARTIATEMGLAQDKIEGIRMAGIIHDIGKLSIPAEILSKPTKLSAIEFSLIKEHARRGYEMLKDVESAWPLAEIVRQHHEQMDGSGYPRNLKGDDILMEARILAVADVVEAMASHRPYRPSLGIGAALNEIEKNKGTLYDAPAVDACLRLFREKSFNLEGIHYTR